MHVSSSKRWLVGLTLVAVLLFSAFLWVKPLLHIGGGYAAKHACSCHFLQGRTLEDISENDLNFSVLGQFSLGVQDRTVESSLFGLVTRRAAFLGERGCVLINDDAMPLPTVVENTPVFPDPAELSTELLPDYDDALDYGMRDVPGGGARGMVILENGRLVAERYREGFDATTPLLGWSMTKTLTGMAIGVYLESHASNGLSPTETVERTNQLFPGIWTDDRSRVALTDLMHMNSGIEWNEGYGSITDATVMLHEKADFAEFAQRHRLTQAPGTVWNYSSGTTNMLMDFLREELGGNDRLYAFLDSLYGPIAPSLVIEPDQSGRPVGSSYGWATTRDWARLGQFMLQNGVWQGDTLLPPGWIDYMREPAAGSEDLYGAQLWLPGPETPSLPEDAFMMRGFQDQRVFIIPSRNLVIARLGHGEDKVTDFEGLISRILAARE
ncbi:serine hydrolase domain-containing protein [Lewinella sp. IMCC34191]|uniref:serine hydrolase domain-containing protein n=1 Tax=Lewinella sp. IMCC34191 TaxID=2259172 RepID=UPI000E221F81|nr:serine hydrolase [Lewinella sp. IMCC34191]